MLSAKRYSAVIADSSVSASSATDAVDGWFEFFLCAAWRADSASADIVSDVNGSQCASVASVL